MAGPSEARTAATAAGHGSAGSSLFEKIITDIPTLLERVPSHDVHRVAATSWTALCAVLRHTTFEVRVRGDILGDNDESFLDSLAARIRQWDVPFSGNIYVRGPVNALMSVDDACAVADVLGELQINAVRRGPARRTKTAAVVVAGLPVLQQVLKRLAGRRHVRVLAISEARGPRPDGSNPAPPAPPPPDSFYGKDLAALLCSAELSTNLTAIELDGVPLAPLAIQMLGCTPNVEVLRLDRCGVGPGQPVRDLVCVLCRLEGLRVLSLQGNGLGDAGVAVLAAGLPKSTRITDLDLASNGIGGDGVEAVCAMLWKQESLLRLSLADNSLQRDFAEIGYGEYLGDHLSEALTFNKVLRELNLQHTDILEEDLDRLIGPELTLDVLDIRNCERLFFSGGVCSFTKNKEGSGG
ncbi:unnamed protein product [Pedinophyceae sp. YPF-701]|nr:unnamed protein product [Pedinophyceae sp. YPF-701]